MATLSKYIVIARIKDDLYMTDVYAISEGGAEHKVLNMGICGRHTYTVKSCQAFGRDDLKTDTFVSSAMRAKCISFDDLLHIIGERNEEIKAKDAAEEKIHEIEEQMAELAKELEAAKKIMES